MNITHEVPGISGKKLSKFLAYAALLLLMLYGLFCCRLVVAVDKSMEPTYYTGDKLLCIRTDSPDVGDPILFDMGDKPIIKRVQAVAGQAVDNAYWGSSTVPEGYVYVVGDNPDHSFDSRDPDFGLVPVEAVWGKVLFHF